MTSIPDCLTEGVLFAQKRSTVCVTNILYWLQRHNAPRAFEHVMIVTYLRCEKRYSAVVSKECYTSNLVPMVSQSEKTVTETKKKTSKEVRLKPVAVNP